MPFFVFIDSYRTRPGTGKTCSLHVTPPVEITPKILANFASLNSSIAFGDLRLGGCLRGRKKKVFVVVSKRKLRNISGATGCLCGKATDGGTVHALHVTSEMMRHSCSVCTFLAWVWFDARVRPHVNDDTRPARRPVCAFLACEWFFARVRHHVLYEMPLLSCPVCTCLACVWFFARVRPHVSYDRTAVSCPIWA